MTRKLLRIAAFLPPADPDLDGPVSGRVFKVDRGPAGEKVAYARLFAGVRGRVVDPRSSGALGAAWGWGPR